MAEDEAALTADQLVVAAARALALELDDVVETVHERLTDEIEPLRGEASLVELLRASIESNLAAFAQMVQYDGTSDRTRTPPAAAEYARRLAQHSIDPSALLRAYRLGQETALLWCLDRLEPSTIATTVEAARILVSRAFQYVDAVSAQVITEYDTERARWLANSNSVRTATLAELLAGPVADPLAAENALGYRLRQHHIGVVLWMDHEGSPSELRALEHLLTRIAKDGGARGSAFFSPQDRSTAWGWLPFGREPNPNLDLDRDLLDELKNLGARVALGTGSPGPDGFRATHLEARRAQELAVVAGKLAPRVTSFGEPDVRAATLLVGDLAATRRMVTVALGPLGADDESAARLRETVRTFLATGGSHAETAKRMNLHKNTVRYRIERAAEMRGRAIEGDRLDVELALIACQRIGPSVLSHAVR